MRRLLILLALLMFVLMSSARSTLAQTPPAWPPDPATLFADGIEIITAEETRPITIPSPPQPIITRCGRLYLEPDAEVALIKKNEHFYICELATGELSQPMPPEIIWSETSDGHVLDVSPDKEWVSYVSHQESSIFHLLAYERSTGRLIDLGASEYLRRDHLQVGWATNTEIYFISRDMPEWTDTVAYVATVPIANSLKMVMYNWRFGVSYYDDPPRFEKLITPGNDERYWSDHQLPVDCTRHVYDIATQITTVYHYGAMCLPEYVAENGEAYYRDIQDDGKTWLIRFDEVTRERQNLYYGEIERLHWVSEDEHYALVILDGSGKTECRPGFEQVDISADTCWLVETPTLNLIDLTSGLKLFTTPPDERITVEHSGRIIPINDHTMVLSYNSYQAGTIRKHLYLQINNDRVDVQTLDGEMIKPIDAEHLILRVDIDRKLEQYLIFSIVTHANRSITNQTSDYQFNFESVKDNIAVISVFPSHGYYSPSPSMHYTVKLPIS